MRSKLTAILLLVASAFAFTACSSSDTTMLPKETNFLGMVKYSPESYANTGFATLAISTDELFARKDFSGNQLSLFWGIVTIKDY